MTSWPHCVNFPITCYFPFLIQMIGIHLTHFKSWISSLTLNCCLPAALACGPHYIQAGARSRGKAQSSLSHAPPFPLSLPALWWRRDSVLSARPWAGWGVLPAASNAPQADAACWSPLCSRSLKGWLSCEHTCGVSGSCTTFPPCGLGNHVTLTVQLTVGKKDPGSEKGLSCGLREGRCQVSASGAHLRLLRDLQKLTPRLLCAVSQGQVKVALLYPLNL